MKLHANDPRSARVAYVLLDGVRVQHCTFADEDAGCVTVLVLDEAGRLVVEMPGCGLPHDEDETPCEACVATLRVQERTLFGTVKIVMRTIERLVRVE